MKPFDFSSATVQEKLDERDRRDECRRRNLPLSGTGTLPQSWRQPPARATFTPDPDGYKLTPAPFPIIDVHRVELATRKITLPWTNLCRDNERLVPIVRRGKPSQVTSKPYADAKKRARDTAKEQLGFQVPLDGPLSFTAILYEPNRHRRDLGNYVKMVADVLSGLTYEDDSQIADLHWARGGIDIDAPRLEITVRQILDPNRSR